MTLEFGDPFAPAKGSPFSFQAPYSEFLVRMTAEHPDRWIVMERKIVPAQGLERQVEIRRMSGRAVNVKRHALRVGREVGVTTRVVGTVATTYVKGEEE